MTEVQRAAAIRGKTIRFTWTEGPTKGTTHEHVFHDDGTVEWRDPGSPSKGGSPKEKPEYAAVQVTDDIYAVSYLAASGYTLTVVLNFRDHRIVGYASSSKDWHPIQGRFEVVNP
ncbi:MAG: MoaF N-terminal domain-containing protein [Gemmatimonadales bacterium]|jgi:molybdenum cofactor biosynthesis protein MoaF